MRSDDAVAWWKARKLQAGVGRGIRHTEARTAARTSRQEVGEREGQDGLSRAVRAADVSNEGTVRSAAWRLPEAGIVKGLASPLTRTPAAERLKLPAAWRAEPAQSQPAQQTPAHLRSRHSSNPAGRTRPPPHIPPAHKHKVFIIC
ncbi:hypothetical protein HA46_06760 [Pantoea septica]|uniref:Uncharacterized protein n=1 Tax=Pantoea septica TaxID=472695 RepID=A0ABX3UTW7_9GAMM|nr:hypothetical protein HA46_06760 [Pantoea septica]